MTIDPFLGPKLKLNRARYFVQKLEDANVAYFGPKPFEKFEDIGDDGMVHVKLKMLRQVPAHFGCIVGDAVHNLRSALDILVTHLARSNGADEKAQEKVYFPVSASQEIFEKGQQSKTGRWSNAGIEKVKALAGADQAKISALKPYAGGNDLLFKLHKFDLLDKHQLLVPVAAAVADHGLTFEPTEAFQRPEDDPFEMVLMYPDGPVFDGMTVMKYSANPPPGFMSPSFSIDLRFGHGTPAPGARMLPLLHDMGRAVADVIKVFDPGPPPA